MVRLPDGSVQVDPTGKKSGRGVYLCWDRRCWESGLKGKGLERGLRTSISPADRAALESYGREAPEGKYEGAYPPLRGVP